jgi:hypothetical protein
MQIFLLKARSGLSEQMVLKRRINQNRKENTMAQENIGNKNLKNKEEEEKKKQNQPDLGKQKSQQQNPQQKFNPQQSFKGQQPIQQRNQGIENAPSEEELERPSGSSYGSGKDREGPFGERGTQNR